MSYERNYKAEDLDAFKIGETYRPECDTIEPYLIGGAYGGKWRPNPNKPQDQRFLGKPGEIKTTYKNGYRVDTKIGEDGRAVTERHYTDHKQTSLDKGTQRKTTENELPSLTQCTA